MAVENHVNAPSLRPIQRRLSERRQLMTFIIITAVTRQRHYFRFGELRVAATASIGIGNRRDGGVVVVVVSGVRPLSKINDGDVDALSAARRGDRPRTRPRATLPLCL